MLQWDRLSVAFGTGEDAVRVVEDVSLEVVGGERVALVGESGCGKSVTALAAARLLPEPGARYVGGAVRFEGRDVLNMSERELRAMRGGGVAYVFQDPGGSLDPVIRVGHQLDEALRAAGRPRGVARMRELLRRVELTDADRVIRAYPHQLSGGMQQRVVMACALASEPRALIADEPTTALDVTTQARLLDWLRRLNETQGLAVLLITHNLGLVAGFAERMYVMYAGWLVEEGPVNDVLRNPAHPYTRGLLRAAPRLRDGHARVEGIPGRVPDPRQPPTGCRFHPRCAMADARCSRDRPPWIATGPRRASRCFVADTLAKESP